MKFYLTERVITMKKALIFLFFLLAAALIFFTLRWSSDGLFITIPRPAPTPTIAATPMPSPTATPVPTPDPRNDEGVIRAEIAAMLRDAKDLLAAGFSDDAAMVLRDLRTRTLTEAEKAEVDALQASMVKVSD